jgi:hypothetical protein
VSKPKAISTVRFWREREIILVSERRRLEVFEKTNTHFHFQGVALGGYREERRAALRKRRGEIVRLENAWGREVACREVMFSGRDFLGREIDGLTGKRMNGCDFLGFQIFDPTAYIHSH